MVNYRFTLQFNSNQQMCLEVTSRLVNSQALTFCSIQWTGLRTRWSWNFERTLFCCRPIRLILSLMSPLHISLGIFKRLFNTLWVCKDDSSFEFRKYFETQKPSSSRNDGLKDFLNPKAKYISLWILAPALRGSLRYKRKEVNGILYWHVSPN
jgi:hypothetical protein